MGAQAGNANFADSARRQQVANEGIRMRREALSRAESPGTAPAAMGAPGSLEGFMSGSAAVSEGAPVVPPRSPAQPPRGDGIDFKPGAMRRGGAPGFDEGAGSPQYRQMMQQLLARYKQ